MELEVRVFFEEPFWVMLCVSRNSQGISCFKKVFGAEPGAAEIFQFVRFDWHESLFGGYVAENMTCSEHHNPKRRQREISRLLKKSRGLPGASLLLQAEKEKMRCEARVLKRQKKEERLELQFEKKAEKRKRKHRGH